MSNINTRRNDEIRRLVGLLLEHDAWLTHLAWYADTGASSPSHSGIKSRSRRSSTETRALAPRDLPARLHANAERSLNAILAELRSLERTHQWTTTTPTKPATLECANPACDRLITPPDHPRNGRCPRCAQHHRRHGNEWA